MKVKVCADPIRVAATAPANDGYLINARWLLDTLPIDSATGMDMTMWNPGASVLEPFGDLGGLNGNELWASLYHASAPLVQFDQWVRDQLAETILVCFEMPPMLEAALNRVGIPWIDVGIGSLRFMVDLPLSLRSNFIGDIRRWTIHQEQIFKAVSKVRGFYGGEPLPEQTVTYVAQTSTDRSVIARSGRFWTAYDVIGQISATAPPGQHQLRVRPHPAEPDSPIVRVLVDSGATLVSEGPYEMISRTPTKAHLFVGISSGLLEEAAWFGHRVSYWQRRDLDEQTLAFRLEEFWADVFRNQAYERARVKPNDLRKELNKLHNTEAFTGCAEVWS